MCIAVRYKVKAYSDQEGIPYSYCPTSLTHRPALPLLSFPLPLTMVHTPCAVAGLTDSRWYQEGKDLGIITWEPRAEHFPSGFPAVTRKLTWKLAAHSRYYSSQTTLAAQNGGPYTFVVQANSSIPMDARYWSDAFAQRSDWGLTMLFQDWLETISDGMDAVNEQPGLGDRWLRPMALAAEKASVSVQYCMATARHLFTALQYRAVTQIRVSDDGMPNDYFNQWQIGESAVLAFALGVIPFKDNFWTTSVQCANPMYGANCTEPNTVLESAVASFSTGAVAPGDAIGEANATLIFRSITREGRLLKPTRPMSSLDLWYVASAAAYPLAWQLQSTYTELAGLRWYYTLAVGNDADLVVGRRDLHLDLDPTPSAYYEYRATMGVEDWGTLVPFRDSHTIPASRLPSFTITHLVPVLEPSGILLIGEEAKWVKVSAQRITALDVSAGSVTVRLSGAVGEEVAMQFAMAGKASAVVTATCALGLDGAGTLIVRADATWSCSGGAKKVGEAPITTAVRVEAQ